MHPVLVQCLPTGYTDKAVDHNGFGDAPQVRSFHTLASSLSNCNRISRIFELANPRVVVRRSSSETRVQPARYGKEPTIFAVDGLRDSVVQSQLTSSGLRTLSRATKLRALAR